jgi:hypothetical protein
MGVQLNGLPASGITASLGQNEDMGKKNSANATDYFGYLKFWVICKQTTRKACVNGRLILEINFLVR